jgi:WD40 repeat protein
VALSVSSDGVRVLLAGREELALLDTAHRIIVYREPSAATAAALAPDGSKVLIATSDRKLCILDFSGSPKLLPRAQDTVAVAASADFRLGAVASAEGIVTLWDLAEARTIDELNLEREKPTSVAFSPDGGSLIVGTARGLAFVFDLRK